MSHTAPIGILGGTFDPLHSGHLQLALFVLQEFHCAEIRLLPCKQPVLKQQAQASTDDRIAMLQLISDLFENIIVDKREVERETPSYMLETLVSLHNDYRDQSLLLILGMDAFVDLAKWHQWQDLLNYCHIVVANRPGYTLELTEPLNGFYQQHKTEKALDLFEQSHGKIHVFEFPAIDVSSTKIRADFAAGKISELLPDDVLRYIQEHALYR